MDFSLSEEQKMLRDQARNFLKKEWSDHLVKETMNYEKGYSAEFWKKIADLGWVGHIFPEEYGGNGGRVVDLAVLYEEMGWAGFPSPHLSTAVLCGGLILGWGSEDQKKKLLPEIAKGDLIMALAWTEPAPCWDGNAWYPEGITTKAVLDGKDYVIQGEKMFVHDAHHADYLICIARTSTGDKPENGITLFLVDAKSPGIQCLPIRTSAGYEQNKVSFNQVRVSSKDILGIEDEGWRSVTEVMKTGVALLCAKMVGAGQRALEIAVDYAKNRVQFDMPIGVNQYIQEHCVYCLSEVDSSRFAAHEAIWRIGEGLPCDFEVAVAKAWTNEAMDRTFWCAHQVLAGAGYDEDAVLPYYTRRLKVDQLYLGDTKYHLNKVAEEMDQWPAPEKGRAKPLGIWDKPEEDVIPAWQPWRERWEAIQKKKEEKKTPKNSFGMNT